MITSASLSPGTTSSSSISSPVRRLNSSSGWIDTADSPLFGGQQETKLVEPPAGTGLDSSLGYPEGDGGLGHGGVEQVAEDEHLPLDGGQPSQHPDQHVPAVDGLGKGDDLGERADIAERPGYFWMTLAVPPALPADVDQDRAAVGFRSLLRVIPAPERPQQGQLQRILGRFPRVEQHERRTQQRCRPRLDELGELRGTVGRLAHRSTSHRLTAFSMPRRAKRFQESGRPRKMAANAGSLRSCAAAAGSRSA